MTHHTAPSPLLQPLLFCADDFANCFFRKPSQRENDFLTHLGICRQLLGAEELARLDAVNERGRTGYTLMSIFSIMALKLLYSQVTMKQTLALVRENDNLRQIIGITEVPSEATMSRLSRQVEKIVDPASMQARVVGLYQQATARIVGHLSIDSTIIEAREKPIKGRRASRHEQSEPKKRGRKRKGSPEEAEYLAEKAREEEMRARYLAQTPEEWLSTLENRCSLTAKVSSKGKRRWYIGYKAHLACDDLGVPLAHAVTGACVHDSNVAIPLMKMVGATFVFLYVLMDKGYSSTEIERFATSMGAVAIIDRPARNGVAVPMDPATAQRYKARTTVERTNSELKDGYLPVKLYRRKEQARYDISLAILLTTIKKVRSVMARMQDRQRHAA